jgi:hypothetical protein
VWKDQNPGWKRVTAVQRKAAQRDGFIEWLCTASAKCDTSRLLRTGDASVTIKKTI